MDRIRKALDLAREERRFPAQDSAPQAPHAPHPVDDTPRLEGGRPRLVSASPGSISYTHTQVFDADPRILESHRIINPAGAGPAAAAFRLLRTQVLQRMREHGWRSLAVLSPGADDGKTTTAVNLAISLANDHHHTVLLVDCDLRRPGIAQALGIPVLSGIDDVLQGRAGIEQCLQHPRGFERLVVMPARAPMAGSSESLSGPRARDLVSELRSRYADRIIVFDLPPVLGADDALGFLPLVECGLMVAAEGSTRREDLLRSMELLRNTPLVGTVLNRATDVNAAYG